MEKERFFQSLHEFLDIKSIPALEEATNIRGIEEFDSMMILTIIAFVDDNFGVVLSADRLNTMKTVGDLMAMIGNEHFS